MIPSLLLFLSLASPSLLTPSTSQELQVRGDRTRREERDSIKVVISDGWTAQGDSADVSKKATEIDLVPGSPLVLTHNIRLVPSGSGSCRCEADFAALRERLERVEKELSALREKCGGAEGDCCTSKESKGAGCSIKPDIHKCPNECSDQGRCVDGKCVCFPGFSGPNCSESNCPSSCNDNGSCVNGQCVCDPGFTGPDCSQRDCPDSCNNRGRCEDGKCVCDSGFTGAACSQIACPGNCNNRGRCVDGQCSCNHGFSGPDCSKKACPDDCNNRGRCVNGKCVCNSRFTGAACSEIACPGNCNSRGRCVNGQCSCNTGFSGPDCSKKACPDDCNNRGRCEDGKCVCDSRFTGAACSEIACPGNCNNRGRCVNGQCSCNTGFSGPDCSKKACPDDCNNRGRCEDGKCVCDSRFTGAACSEIACPGNCNNRGRCVNGQCSCNTGFSGPDCSKKACPDDCNNRGRCEDGKCVCDSRFTGAACSEIACPGNCNNRGRCVDGQCSCNPGFSGPDCSKKACPDDCNNRGRCENGKCVCDSRFTGAACSEIACPGNCNSRGRCVNGQCSCNTGFSGPDCSKKACPDDCNNRGRCEDGKCVCNSRFTGAACSEIACPGNCNNRGSCINGECVCNDGFSGPECSTLTCPDDCNGRGMCVDGKCVCGSGFTGADCSEIACPGNCNNRGSCDNGQCICNNGFTGADCAEKTCPKNCHNRGQCVNGKCICDVGIAGPQCGTKACLNNCSRKGRCIKGRCVCRPGFAGQDCSHCEMGKTGPSCDTVMSAISHLSTRDITETTVTLDWTPPSVEYETYHITFTSQKEGDQQITVQVDGSLTSFSQTGLASGQEYTISITGEIDGRRGAESSAEFITLVSGPTNLQVVKTTTTSAVVQWEQSEGDIDRYRLTVTPNDAAGRSHEMIVPSGQNSAHIQQLEAGRLYDVNLVAEKGSSLSEPATTQVTPGKLSPTVTVAALTMGLTIAPRDVMKELDPSPKVEVSDQQVSRENRSETNPVKVGGVDGPNKDSAALSTMSIDGHRSKLSEKPTSSKRPHVPRKVPINMTRVAPGARKVRPTTLKKPPIGEKKKKVPTANIKLKQGVLTIGNRTKAVTMRDTSVEPSSNKRNVVKAPAIVSGNHSVENRQSSLEESTTTAVGSKTQPDVDTATHEKDTAPVFSQPIDSVKSQEKKCMNKIKVTHIKLPLMDRGNGCRGDVTGLVRKTPNSRQESSETDGPLLIEPSSEADINPSPEPLPKLLMETYDGLNITTFAVNPLQTPNISVDAERGTSSSASSSTTSQSISKTKSLPLTTSPSPSPDSTESATLSSSTSLSTSPPSSLGPFLSSSTLSPSAPGVDKSVSVGSNERNVNGINATDVISERKLSPSGKGGLTLLHRTRAKSGYVRRPHPNLGMFRNKTNLNVRARHQSPHQSNPTPGSRTETGHVDTPGKSGYVLRPHPNSGLLQNKTHLTFRASSEERRLTPSGKGGRPLYRRKPPQSGYVHRPHPNLGLLRNKTQNLRGPQQSTPLLNFYRGRGTGTSHVTSRKSLSPPSSSASEESSSVEANVPRKDMSGYKDEATTPPSSEVEETERGPLPIRHYPLNGGYLRRPHQELGPLLNRTRLYLRLFPPSSKPLKPASEKMEQQVSSTEFPGASSPSSLKEPQPDEGKGATGEEIEDIVKTSASTESNHNLGGNKGPSSHIPTTKVGYFRRPPLVGIHFPNRTRTNLSPPQHPNKGNMGGPGSQNSHLEKASQIDKQTREQDAPLPTQTLQIRQIEEQNTAEVIPSAQIVQRDSTGIPKIKELEGKDNAPGQTTKSGEEESQTPDSNPNFDINKEQINGGKNTGAPSPGRASIKQSTSHSRQGAPRSDLLPKRHPPTRGSQMRNFIQRSQKTHTMTNNTAKQILDGKTQQTTVATSKPIPGSDMSSSGATREHLENVGMKNETSDRFTFTRDSPEGSYKNFGVRRKEPARDAGAKIQRGNKKTREEEQEDSEKVQETNLHPTTKTESGKGEDENTVPVTVITQVPRRATAKPATGSDKASAHSSRLQNQSPQTEYTITLLGNGETGLFSSLHKLVISTGPEPPTNIDFSKVTDNSMTVSWTKPKSPISSFKVTYTNIDDGEPVSVSVNSDDSNLALSQLTPGSAYEVSIMSVLGLDESDAITDSVKTLPDRPTELRIVNVTDSKALLLWRPALAAVDEYAIVYGSGTGSELRVTVSGNAAEKELSSLEESTTYTVTITSRLSNLESSPTTTSFTTHKDSGRDGKEPGDLQVSNVTPRAALLSWKLPTNAIGSSRLTYQTEGQDVKEAMVDASATEYNLTKLQPGSKYKVQLQLERGGTNISTEFTTGTLRFPFPTDCSQELLNGMRTSGEVEIFLRGKTAKPTMVYCDMETVGGGWTVFQRRKDGSVNFFRGWNDYVKGFGDLSGEFWLGLDILHDLTAMTRMSLHVDLRDNDESVFAKYSKFEVAKKNFRLTVGGYSGNAGDSLTYHNNRAFSTKDRDSAPFITRCAMSYRGGWWYKNCHEANLNGLYGIDVKHQGVIWTSWKGKDFSIPFTEMKLRPAAFSPPTRG